MCGFMACSSTRDIDNKSQVKTYNPNEIENLGQEMDLTQHLRKVPGLQVQGQGADADIRVRAASSYLSATDPLFIVDGNQIRDYAAVYAMVNVLDIQRVNVLKDASETAFYGVQGANGVVLITMKKG